jgi:hypothetical protein
MLGCLDAWMLGCLDASFFPAVMTADLLAAVALIN